MNFWDLHGSVGGIFFLMFLLIVPRVTLFFTTALSALVVAHIIIPLGLTGWLGIIGFPLSAILTIIAWMLVIVSPKLIIAIAAAMLYAKTDATLVFMAGVIAAMDVSVKAYIYRHGFLATAEKAFEKLMSWKWAQKRIKPFLDEFVEYSRRAQAEREEEIRRFREAGRRTRARQSGTKPWYKILGVNKSSSLDEVKKAYRKKAKRLHPDLPQNKGGNPAKFSELTEAYEEALEHHQGES